MKAKALLTKILAMLKQWFITNTGMKIGILVFAALVWFITIMGNQYTYTFDMKLEVRNVIEGKTLKEKLPHTIQANFTGKGLDFFYLLVTRKSSFKFVLDLQNIRWFYDFNLNDYYLDNPEKIIIPRNVNVTFNHIVYPETLRVELDRLDVVRIPVNPRITIKEAPGYIKVGRLQIEPDSVTLSGPRTHVKRYRAINTEEYNLKNCSTPLNIDLSLDIPEGENIEFSTRTVYLTQNVEQIVERVIPNVPVRIVNAPSDVDVELSPSVVAVTVSGSVSILKATQPEDIRIYFDFAREWRHGEFYYQPAVELPAGILSWSNMTPRRIEVRVLRSRTS